MWSCAAALIALTTLAIACDPPELSARGGRISSPNFPDPFPPYIHCIYNLTSPVSGQVVHLRFTHFNLAPADSRSGQCLRDYLLVVITVVPLFSIGYGS
jgi:hypothetical protein